MPNITSYATFAMLTMLVMQEPSWMLDYQKRQRDLREQQITEKVLQSKGLVAVSKESWSSGKVHEFETEGLPGDVGEKAKEAHETIGSFFKKWR